MCFIKNQFKNWNEVTNNQQQLLSTHWQLLSPGVVIKGWKRMSRQIISECRWKLIQAAKARLAQILKKSWPTMTAFYVWEPTCLGNRGQGWAMMNDSYVEY